MSKLINTRFPCNTKIEDHPTVQVYFSEKETESTLGVLGILNGFFGVREDGFGPISLEVDSISGIPLKFKETPTHKEA